MYPSVCNQQHILHQGAWEKQCEEWTRVLRGHLWRTLNRSSSDPAGPYGCPLKFMAPKPTGGTEAVPILRGASWKVMV